MVETLEMDKETVAGGRNLPRVIRTYAFLSAVVVGLLLGVGLRFVPPTSAASPDSSTSQGAGSTACAAQ